ncbi:hypothetical protein EUGRSUZ_A00334 [Eucalyptus grandis]|uniref:Uncharacterized protein n=2 Tax=Eucalyptus grandis TaxID=71139 RepID=A0A059DB45_EUCGR|nr:hypothetical protein EUGRSUZ_A00334 [Eucalyptus grandis]
MDHERSMCLCSQYRSIAVRCMSAFCDGRVGLIKMSGTGAGKIKFKAFDLGGRQIARRVWPDYYAKVDAVIYVVPFLMLGNKIDIPHAASEDELGYHLGLTDFTTGKGKVNFADQTVRPLEVFMCSVVRKMGYGEGFEWMSQYIK